MSTFEVFFDGECPLCTREIDMVKRFDKRGALRFVDIAAPGFDPSTLGRTYEDLMARIHARDEGGELVTGVEVFRQMYAAIGLGPIVALTRVRPFSTIDSKGESVGVLPARRPIAEASYRWFAKNRLRLTGRCDSETCAVRT